eukprot:TRINITY_DN4776_c0_g2_i1.p1 TRINITY_DN4776_c0_g2~~TRINITY_DN4776_c0_g2_i1.p1  ORF type:complete len:106 (+),score=25.40 TRINITY_DN4776_c0_g2_i1:523-840(+)
MEPSSYGSGSEKVKKKHKNKKHKASQAACLRHLLENMPPDSSASSSHGDVKMDTQYESESMKRKDKKNKKLKKLKKDDKKKKKIKHKDEDDRPDKAPSHFNNHLS